MRIAVRSFPAVSLLTIGSVLAFPGLNANLNAAQIFPGTIIVMRLFMALGQFLTSALLMLTDIRSSKNIETLIRNVEEDISESQPETRSGILKIELEMLTFGFSQNEFLFQALNFSFQKGIVYAVVGPSGCGKSTLADILLGHIIPLSGRIFVNDEDGVLDKYRLKIILAEQNPRIFSGSIRENLLIGREFSDKKLIDVLKIVDLDETILGMPLDLSSPLSYQGDNFSGGQKQRLGIARALLSDPEVLILDEATSGLDSITRIKVTKNLINYFRTGILIFITHDQDLVKSVDQVLVMDSSRGINNEKI